ncbi:MAG: radical SAM protein [Actinomycetota bacterium]|nr:radical SAM protein [Actinomycetota bacterium]
MSEPPQLRWQIAGQEDDQEALFDSPVEREFGRGEFRGLEFLHVRAKRLINEVPKASHMPFRYTINAYRGCSHACSYCLSGQTSILMADGRTKPLAQVRVGDAVYGTVRQGAHRRYGVTHVLNHWSTVKPAYRVTLGEGTQLVTSGDHRFLTERGWKHVTGPGRPHLRLNNKLMGVGELASYRARYPRRPRQPSGAVRTVDPALSRVPIEGEVVLASADLEVVSIEPLRKDLPLFDITTGTGDFVAEGVVSHNCFARPSHEYLGMNAGEDFERRIVVKVNAVELARAETVPGRWAGDHIAMGTNTDPYQRCEAKYKLTRGVVEVLTERANPFSILTKNTLMLRDLDLLAEASRRCQVAVNFSIGTLDEQVWRSTEPSTPHPMRRVEAVARFNEAGVPCGVLIAPVLPGLSDSPEQLEAVVKACLEAGARSITPILLHLRPGVKEQYMPWLAEARPDLLPRYRQLYPRSYAPKKVQEELSDLIRELVEAHGGVPDGGNSRAIYRTGSAKVPPAGEQLKLRL